MEPNVQKVGKFLIERSGKYYCDKCLSELTGVTPRNQVNQITRPLALSKEYRRVDAKCEHCRKSRTCTSYVGESLAAAS